MRQHSLDIGINGCANRCEFRTIAVAVKKLLAEAALEFFDTQTDRRLRQSQLKSAGAKGAKARRPIKGLGLSERVPHRKMIGKHDHLANGSYYETSRSMLLFASAVVLPGSLFCNPVRGENA
jgi:hypothetical protein